MGDADETKVGTTMSGVPIHHVDEMEQIMKQNKIDAAILTVPSAYAQPVADDLVRFGIKGILNFTPARLTVPDTVRSIISTCRSNSSRSFTLCNTIHLLRGSINNGITIIVTRRRYSRRSKSVC